MCSYVIPLLVSLLTPAAEGAAPPIIDKLRTAQQATSDAAVVVGIEDYAFVADVPFALRDADAFRNWLLYTRGLPVNRVSLLTSNPTASDIRTALKTRAKEVGAGGTLWVYFAGHGSAHPETGKRLLLGVDVQPKTSSLNDKYAVQLDELEAIATSSGAGHVVAVVDACYAGTGRNGKALLEGKRFAMPVYAAPPTPKVTYWTAASPSEVSGPYDPAQHGLFTYFVVGALRGWADGELDGQRDGEVTLAEASRYVYDAVRGVAGGEQQPALQGGDALLRTPLSVGRELETGPDLAELMRGTTGDKPKPASATVSTDSSFQAKLEELRRRQAERQAQEEAERAELDAMMAERDRQVAAARSTLLTEAASAWEQTAPILDGGGSEAEMAARLYIETYGSAVVTWGDTTTPVKVPQVAEAQLWLERRETGAPLPPATPAAAPNGYADLLDGVGSLQDFAQWHVEDGSSPLAIKLEKKVAKEPWDDELWGKIALTAVKKGDLDLAAHYYLRAVYLDPIDPEWRSALGIMGVEDPMLRAVADQVRVSPESDEAWGNLGDAFSFHERTEEACTAYHRARELDASDDEWVRGLEGLGCAEQAPAMSTRTEAVAEYAEEAPDDDERIGDYADALMEQGLVAEACDQYQRALELDPDDSEWPDKLLGCLETSLLVIAGDAPPGDDASLRYRLGQVSGGSALDAALAAVDADSSNDELWGDVGDALSDSHTELALEAYTKAMQLDATDREWHTRLAEVGSYDTLFASFRARIGEQPSNDELYGDYGDRLAEAGRTDEACEAYAAALRFDADDEEWLRSVEACGRGELGLAAEAAEVPEGDGGPLQVLRDQLRYDEGNDELWGDYGDALHGQGDDAEACAAYARARELDPADNEWAQALIAYSCASLGVGEGAAGQAGNDDDEALGDRADELMEAGRLDEACTTYRRALDTDPTDSEWPGKLVTCLRLQRADSGDEVLGDLGDQLATWGRGEEACMAWRAALDLDSDDSEWLGRAEECGGSGGPMRAPQEEGEEYVGGFVFEEAAAEEEAPAIDDERLGDAADELLAAGVVGEACMLFKRAMYADRTDTEWPDKLVSCYLRWQSDGTDEELGDVGDDLSAWGREAEACTAWRGAAQLDPGDEEWQRKSSGCN